MEQSGILTDGNLEIVLIVILMSRPFQGSDLVLLKVKIFVRQLRLELGNIFFLSLSISV